MKILPYFSIGGIEISSSMLHYFFIVIQFNEAEMEGAHLTTGNETHIQCIVVKVATQANALPGDVLTG